MNSKNLGKILIVSSNSSQIKEFAQLFSVNNFDVLISNNFNQAKGIFDKKKPDAVLIFFHEISLLNDLNIFIENLNHAPCKIMFNNLSGHSINNLNKNFSVYTDKPITKNEALNFFLNKITNSESTKTINALIVEDSLLNQLYYDEIIKQLDIKTTIVNSEIEAINAISKNKYDIIISDITLQNGNGINVLKYSKKTAPSTPFIIVSGKSKDEILKTYGELAFDEFLNKPVDEIILFETIESLLKKEKTRNLLPNIKTYNYKSILDILKGDEAKIKISINEFIDLLKKTKAKSDDVLLTQNTDELRPLFHDLLNLCFYYGAHELKKQIEDFRKASHTETKMAILILIDKEVKNVLAFFSNQKNIKY